MNKFSTFFKEFPNKVLGVFKESSSQFGEKIQIVSGEFALIERIDVSSSLEPQVREFAEVVNYNAMDNVLKSLEKTQRERKEESKEKIVLSSSNSSVYIASIPDSEMYKGDEAFNFLNPGIEQEDCDVWIFYCQQQNRPVHEYLQTKFSKNYPNSWFIERMESGHLCYDPETKTYIPRVIYYSGNIYEKISKLKNAGENFESLIGAKQYKRQLENLEQIKPTELLLTGDVETRLMLDSLSKFCQEFTFDYFGESKTILSAFKDYLREVDSSEQLTDVRLSYLYSYILEGDQLPRYVDKDEKEEIKRKCLIEQRHFMILFLENLPLEVRTKIEKTWNYENNGFVDPNYNQVPIMFEISKTFKNKPLSIRPEQREGVAFQEIKGTGVCGFDVGVGKTLTSILTIAQFMQSGRCKRPILVVPKPTYYKWIGEIHGIVDEFSKELLGTGILPQYRINSFYNFGSKIQDTKIEVEDYTITIITYQGAKNLGFSDDFSGEFLDKLFLIMDQYDPLATDRQNQAGRQKIKTALSEGKASGKIMMDEYFWDYLIMDEAHNANKIFMSVKGTVKEDGERENSHFSFGGGQPSQLGRKMFFLSQYVQKNANGLGNVNLLTATPFTNNPLNVYNIFALANFDILRKYGIENVNTFFEKYVDVTFENVVTSKGTIESKQVIKGWKNKVALQKILFGIINYKSAADSPSVKRPEKIVFPLLNETINGQILPLPKDKQISTILKPTAFQKNNQKAISDWLTEQLKDSELKKLAPHLVADIMASKNTLSPHIYAETPPELLDPKEFISESPKLNAMVQVMKGINDWFDERNVPRGGQIVYINGGINYMPLIKRYLLENLGYKSNVLEYGKNKYFDEVEILAGDEVDDELKEDVKNAFNAGIIKVVIGSSTIREGIDLQNRTSTLHNLWIDWNPTDYKQLEGRAWRFGNMFDYVRIISYLVAGGSDAFKFQKLEEKTARINDIFDRANKANILEVTDEDREAVKWALIDDVMIIANELVKQKVSEIEKLIKINEENIESYKSLNYKIEQLKINESKIEEVYNLLVPYLSTLEYKSENPNPDIFEKISVVTRNYSQIRNSITIPYEIKNKATDWQFTSSIKSYKDYKKQIDKLDERALKDQGQSVFLLDTEILIQDLSEKNEKLRQDITYQKSEENISSLAKEIQAKKDATEAAAGTPEIIAKKIIALNDKVLKVITVEQELSSPDKETKRKKDVAKTVKSEVAKQTLEIPKPIKEISEQDEPDFNETITDTELKALVDNLLKIRKERSMFYYLKGLPKEVVKMFSYIKADKKYGYGSFNLKFDNQKVKEFFYYAYAIFVLNEKRSKEIFLNLYGEDVLNLIEKAESDKIFLKNGASLFIDRNQYNGAIERIQFNFPSILSDTNMLNWSKKYLEFKRKPSYTDEDIEHLNWYEKQAELPLTTEKSKSVKVEKTKPTKSEKTELEEAILALESTLEFVDSESEKRNIEEAIEALKVTLEIL